ncbi:MAG: RNA polymerase sigma factor [Planctomycetota bacterium]
MHRSAQRILRRFRDAATVSHCEDLVQESCVLLWQWIARCGQVRRVDAATRTVCYRRRRRSIAQLGRASWLQFVDFGSTVCEPAESENDAAELRIAGRRVPSDWAMEHLPTVLGCLTRLDQKLLLGLHEGFCCAELALRFGRSEACVKTRIHRARKRVRTEFEALVRQSDEFDDLLQEKET